MEKDNLTKLQRAFVEEYLVDPSDGGAAYIRANPKVSKASAKVAASKLLSMDKIQEALKTVAKSKLGVLEARIMQNIEFWLDIRDNPNNRPADRMKASENLGKYMQMFVEKKEVSVEASVKIVDDIG